MRQRADTHVHTLYSGIGKYGLLRFPESITQPEKMVDSARKKGLDIICITDHNAMGGAVIAENYAKKFDDIEVVKGEEVSTADGEVVGLWMTEEIPAGLSIEETIDRIREQGGLTIAPHPFSFHVPGLGDRVFDVDLDGIETLNGGHIDRYSNAMASAVAKRFPGRWAEIGSSDSHSISTFGYSWTEFEGAGGEDLRKAILDKTTVAGGTPVPLKTAVWWSMEVAVYPMRMILRSLFGRLKDDPANPMVEQVKKMRTRSKIAAVVGATIYILPPIPYIAGLAGPVRLNKTADRLLGEMEDRLNALQLKYS